MKNLLIESIPGSGKTTLIADCIDTLGLRPFCAGYQTARVYGTDGTKRGFVHLSAKTNLTDLMISDEPLLLFLEHEADGENPVFHKDVFLKSINNTLIPVQGDRLILIDEMGGGELELTEAVNAYMTALKGNLPVVGVLKHPDHARKFSYPAYLRFCEEISKKTDTEIIKMDTTNREEIRTYLLTWLKDHT